MERRWSEFGPDERCTFLYSMQRAHQLTPDMRAAASFQERLVVHYGEMKSFNDEGNAMCDLGNMIVCNADVVGDASLWFERARKIGADHGCFQLELEPSTLNPNTKPETLNPKP